MCDRGGGGLKIVQIWVTSFINPPYRSQWSNVSPANNVVVGELEEEEDGYAAPDGDVVVSCPVSSVERDLETK